MKALTLTQPWATLVAVGAKRVETRGWRSGYLGPIAIHAAKGMTVGDLQFAHELRRRGVLTENDVIAMSTGRLRGVVVATARLAGVVTAETLAYGGLRGPKSERWAPLSDLERELGDYSDGRYAWLLDDVEQLADPIAARGALGLWDWPAP